MAHGYSTGQVMIAIDWLGYILIGNTVREKLELVINTRAMTLSTPADERTHEISSLTFTLVEYKSLFEMLDGLWLEARQTRV